MIMPHTTTRRSSSSAITPAPPSSSFSFSSTLLQPSMESSSRRRQTYLQARTTNSTPHQQRSSPLHHIRRAAATQEALDARRRKLEEAIATGPVNQVVVAAIQALMRSIHADRETVRACLKTLLFDEHGNQADTLAQAQGSQARLLDRAAHALAFAPLVQRVEAYLRDRNLPPRTVAYCLDAGAASWLRVRVSRLAVSLPAGTAAAEAFSTLTVEVTRQLPLIAVGPNIRSLHRLFTPLTVALLHASSTGTDERERELKLILELSSPQRFAIEAYGFRTHFPAAVHAADAALLKKWVGQVCPPTAAGESEGEGEGGDSTSSSGGNDFHLLGLRIPIPHPRLVPQCAPTPLAVKLQIAATMP